MAKPATLTLYDEITGDTVQYVSNMLSAAGDQAITVRISSPGGDAFAGTTCFNLLAEYPGAITCRIDGIAASSASLIAMAADRIIAPENSYMVIHEPIGIVVGPAGAHRAMAADLSRMAALDAGVYSKRSGQSIEAVRALMAEDRLMTAGEAKALGYIDEIETAAELVAAFDLSKLSAKYRDRVMAAFVRDPRMANLAIVADKRRLQEQLRAELGIGAGRGSRVH